MVQNSSRYETDSNSEEQYIAVNTQSYPAGEGEGFLWDYTRGVFHQLSEPLLQVLQVANRFCTLKEHRDALIEAGWQDDGSGNIEHILNELVQNGLLRAKGSFLKALIGASAQATDTPLISSLGWVTRDRPELLKRSVESFIRNCLEHNRAVEYRIFDDSAEEKVRCRTRRGLTELAKDRSVKILYAGQDEKRAFAARILREAGSAKLPAEVVEFALFDPFRIEYTTGANGNAFLLGTVGELSLMIDDDVVGKFYGPSEPAEGLALHSSPDPTQFRFFPDRAKLLEAVDLHDLGILECHERLLGKPLSECVSSAMQSEQIEVSGLTADWLPRLEANPGKIAVTMTGACGDSGMGSSRMFLGLTGTNREALLATEENYRSSLTSREVLRVTSSPTIGQGGLFMTMNSGFDSRDLLPPFFPVLRGSDGLFSQTLRACQPGSMIGYLPVACFHDPQERRAHPPGEAWSSSIRMIDLLMLLVQSFKNFRGPAAGERNLRDLGDYLIGLAEMSASRFVESLSTLWVAEAGRYIDYLEYLLAVNDFQPDYWAEDVSKYIESARRRILSRKVMPDDLGDRFDDNETERLSRELVAAFGKLICWWPLIWETARSLKPEGATMFVRL
jgi:hypothetical protein